jgi:hypothetical protein
MGADQIGYLLIGPETLSETKIAAATREVKAINAELTNYKEGDRLSPEAKWFLECKTCEYIENVEDIEGLLADPEELLDEIVEAWNGGYRDVATKALPNRKQAFWAGGMSWGDSPDGAGYKAMEAAYAYGIFETLGIS